MLLPLASRWGVRRALPGGRAAPPARAPWPCRPTARPGRGRRRRCWACSRRTCRRRSAQREGERERGRSGASKVVRASKVVAHFASTWRADQAAAGTSQARSPSSKCGSQHALGCERGAPPPADRCASAPTAAMGRSATILVAGLIMRLRGSGAGSARDAFMSGAIPGHRSGRGAPPSNAIAARDCVADVAGRCRGSHPPRAQVARRSKTASSPIALRNAVAGLGEHPGERQPGGEGGAGGGVGTGGSVKAGTQRAVLPLVSSRAAVLPAGAGPRLPAPGWTAAARCLTLLTSSTQSTFRHTPTAPSDCRSIACRPKQPALSQAARAAAAGLCCHTTATASRTAKHSTRPVVFVAEPCRSPRGAGARLPGAARTPRPPRVPTAARSSSRGASGCHRRRAVPLLRARGRSSPRSPTTRRCRSPTCASGGSRRRGPCSRSHRPLRCPSPTSTRCRQSWRAFPSTTPACSWTRRPAR
jgi:hypothetical protein